MTDEKQLAEKFKEIRSQFEAKPVRTNPAIYVFSGLEIQQIQSETYKLGRDEVMGIGKENAWSLPDVLAKLIESTEILMNKEDYDGHGWEEIAVCITKGKEYLSQLKCS